MKRILHPLRVRPRLITSVLAGLLAAWLLPGVHNVVTRSLFGWNVTVWLYLALVGLMMMRADHERLRRIAVAQAEGAGTVLTTVVLARIFRQ
jgi:uncharacterized membrane protein